MEVSPETHALLTAIDPAIRAILNAVPKGSEVKALRTARQRHHRISGNTWLNDSPLGDVCYFNHDGRGDGARRWRLCDPALVPFDGGWRLEFMPYTATIPAFADGTFERCDLRSDGITHKRVPWSVTIPGAAHVSGVLDGHTVTYPDAMGTGVDVVVLIMGHGIQTTFRIAPDSPAVGPFDKILRFPDGAILDRGYILDRRGPKICDSATKTVVSTDAGDTFIQPFRWWSGADHTGQGGILPVTMIPNSDGSWTVRKPIPDKWNREKPLVIDLTDTTTVSTGDGYEYRTNVGDTWAQCHDGVGIGSDYTQNATQTEGSWISTKFWCMRMHEITTNAVPAGYTISAVTLRNVTSAVLGSGGKTSVYLGTQAVPLVNADYQSYGTTLLSNTPTILSAGNNVDHVLNATGLALVSPGSTNKWCFREYDHDALNATPGTTRYGVQYISANNASSKPTMICTYSDTTAPVCTITGPTAAAQIGMEAMSTAISGTASDAVGVASVSWSNDRGGSGACSGTTTWSATATLKPGKNILTVTALDAASNSGTDTLTVWCIRPPAIDIRSRRQNG